ncbi:hypothetical protein, partial [Microcoleus sp. herbarium14]|uniref:hypothetical protein n=1 Tax=Microcoleus sp. herbarium14 TaxID=3055439 RepID=UPI002FD46F18
INWALHRNDINGGHGSAVSLQSIAVGKRHCRVLIVGNINFDATRFDCRLGLSSTIRAKM